MRHIYTRWVMLGTSALFVAAALIFSLLRNA